MQIREFLAEHPVQLEILSGPDATKDADGWEHNAYRVELRLDGRSMIVPWRSGLGITNDPDNMTVLDSLASESAGYDNAQTFEDWAAEYGYDSDSRKAERIYRQVRQQDRELRALLGDAAADELLWKVERQ